MNRLIPEKLAIICVIVWACSCRDQGNSPAKDPFTALNKPPFKEITDSIKQSPGIPSLYIRRAGLLSQNNMHELATPDYKKAWELSGEEGIDLELISNLLITGHLAEGIKHLKEGAQQFPDNTEFNRRLAEVYLQKGQPADAMHQYTVILARDSLNFEAWYEKGMLLARLGDTTSALQALEKSFLLLPINYSGLSLANIYAAKKDPRALVICNYLLRKDSGQVQTGPVYMKGVYYSEIKQYDSAMQQFDLCIRRDWKMTDAYIEKGIILFETKRIDSAMNVFNMAATVSNTDADAYYWMGRCFEVKGDKQQAAANFDRAAALDDGFSEARAALQRVTK